jgi:amidase
VLVSTEGQEHVPSAVGYMSRDLATTTYISKLVANSQPWKLDPRCSPLSWNETAFQDVQSRPLVIGLIADDGVARVHPPIARALKELSEALQLQGHEIIAWDASDHAELIEIMDLYYTADGGEDIRRDVAAAGEPFLPHVEALVNRGKPISVYEYWQLNRRKLAAQKRYLDKWNAARSPTGRPVDVLLSPTMPHVAVPHRACRWVGYTKIWNILDYPAITFPVDKVRPEKDTLPANEPAYVPRSDLDAWLWDLYNPELMAGHPVNLQVIGQKLEEEKVLGALAAIEKIWKASQKV